MRRLGYLVRDGKGKAVRVVYTKDEGAEVAIDHLFQLRRRDVARVDARMAGYGLYPLTDLTKKMGVLGLGKPVRKWL